MKRCAPSIALVLFALNGCNHHRNKNVVPLKDWNESRAQANSLPINVQLKQTGSDALGQQNIHEEKRESDVGPIAVTPVIASAACTGPRLGIYSWDQQMSWRTPDSPLIKHLSSKNAKSNTCGDVTVNVADFSNAHKIYNSEVLVPFIENVRRAGNDGTVYLSYGDVKTKNVTAARMFIDTFFDWVATVPREKAQKIAPLGVSFDIEHFPVGRIEILLKHAQSRKQALSNFPIGSVLIQWTIEGRINPVDTDAVMRYADSALMMAYRNYMSKPGDETGAKNGLLRRLNYMLREQCSKCLVDDYAKKYYKAKITVMVESACNVDEYCDRLSFCAFDGPGNRGGVGYLHSTLQMLDAALVSSGLLTSEQKSRLFNMRAPYSVHHWEWFQCYYQDPSDTNSLCNEYHGLAATCRGSL